VNLDENRQETHLSTDKLRAMIEKNFLTAAGKALAKKILLAMENTEK
jgi:hypothetical protein